MSGRRLGGLVHHVSAVGALRHPRPRCFSAVGRRQDAASKVDESDTASSSKDEPKEESAMARRLSEMTEQAMLEGGRSARKNMQQAGFSEELKRELEDRIAESSFKSEYAAAHSILDMPESAGQGTRDNALAEPWSGAENLHDITLRMLDSSAKKPMRTPYKIPQPVDMRITPKPKKSPGLRIAEAKERTSVYALSQDPGISDKEREAMRREMRERFTVGARPMPATVQGLSSLANERIEDAMARGQFDRIQRGRGVNTKTDHNANSAFIDTTEYFMNKMIQKQELVPPWIEKQQELAKEVDRFRQRLRSEWRRHAARLISSQGGSLEAQMRRAEAYAAAEARLTEKARIERSFREMDEGGDSSLGSTTPESSMPETGAPSGSTEEGESLLHLSPLRDPNYLAIEQPFYELTVKNLNALTRTYNLQAPPVAQKPYINLERELTACYAEVAPGLAEEIKRRATERTSRPESMGSKASGVLDSLTTSQTVRVYEEDGAKGYGFKEFWRDLFSKKE
ncbi:hypothetical protein BDV59DRAFT_61962 [Aspergillus ambiguus]|uniref:DnaJ family domain-containing protein n=1 Tax=Aspergillus ambiguus TaxID=176160 RepID=UPI003CCE43E0